MATPRAFELAGLDTAEVNEWLEALADVVRQHGLTTTGQLLGLMQNQARRLGVPPAFELTTPYINTIPVEQQPPYPGNLELEKRIKNLVRWNAMAMVVRANRQYDGIGGHISTYASAATLYEVGFNHFFRARGEGQQGDAIYFQGHASPGIYARAYLEGRLTEEHLHNFRNECGSGASLASYPHPWLMPEFWEHPTVSMGLGPLLAAYHARFNRYLEARQLRDTAGSKVWCFVGDGECDEPETLASIALAGREQLDNLIFVVNCNLQRLDGPVRGNGKIIQELESVFRGAGWNVIKVIWGSDWDPLLQQDRSGLLVEQMNRTVDGEWQKFSVAPGSYLRQHLFAAPELAEMVRHLSDDQLRQLNRGGHDSYKVYAAYAAAVAHRGQPTVVLAKTIKGYGLGEAGEGRNITHKQKDMNQQELWEFRARFGIPIGEELSAHVLFYKPGEDSPELRYLQQRRRALGGYVPARRATVPRLELGERALLREFHASSEERPVATTMAYVRMLNRLLRDEQLGPRIVPVIPDEARTFGMDALFRQYGIYSRLGQRYEPVDRSSLLYYRESERGQLLEEGISEAGAMASFIAAGTSAAEHDLAMIPFYTFYSMFGFQRIGDLIWAAGDARARGFLLGATAGRTTLAGEGLQHQDGQSLLLAAAVPNLLAYDPAYAYELAVIIEEGLRRMYDAGESIFYYITLYNEPYPMPAMPAGVSEGILKGMYRLQSSEGDPARGRPQLLGSGPLLREALGAQQLLAERYRIGCDVWSVTSYKELRREALAVERWNRLHPGQARRRSYLERALEGVRGPFVAVSDYLRLVPEQIARWLPAPFMALGTDGYGRSCTRAALRQHFEVNASHITFAALTALAAEEQLNPAELSQALHELGIDPEATDPVRA